MKFSLLVLAGVGISIFILVGQAGATVLDFNSLPNGTYAASESNHFFDGVHFDNNGGSFRIVDNPVDSRVDDIYGDLRQDVVRVRIGRTEHCFYRILE